MSRTPVKHNISLDSLNLSFKSPKSPAQETSPLTKRLLVILQQLSTNYISWQTLHRKGITICRLIETTKCKALEKQTPFPDELEPLCRQLDSTVNSLKEVVSKTHEIAKQISALSKLDKENVSVLKSWDSKKSHEFLQEVLKAFEEELKIKKLVKENIAFCLSHAELIHMSCVWEYQFYMGRDISMGFSALGSELG
uniref:Cyclin-dependent kinase 2-interacting protein n=1 Tax=Phlebotomus papatasi TaxID=29031 RepID=A0A1B0D8E7_PHLPP